MITQESRGPNKILSKAETTVRLCPGAKDTSVLRREREEMEMSSCGLRGRVLVGPVGSPGFKS